MAATLYFDLGSPYVYLAVERLARFDLGDVRLRPVSLGALFKYTGRSSWGLGPDREGGMSEVERFYALPPVRWPEAWPANYLRANRACVAAEEAGRLEPFVTTALRLAFVEGADLGGEEAYLEAARLVGLDPEAVRVRIEEQELKDRLREYTDAAHASGVVGVPTVQVGETLFWGDDRLEAAAEAANSSNKGQN